MFQLDNFGSKFGKNFMHVFQVAKAARLDKFELPAKIKLIPESWTPDSGLVTAALKLKREPLKARYKNELEKLYQ